MHNLKPSLPLVTLDITDIIQACRQESQRSRDQETGFCFELFRRALDDRDEIAWTALKEQYEGLIRSWVYHAAALSIPSQTVEELVQDALTRFWRTLGQQSSHLEERFNHVGGLLNYLQRCAVASCLDWQRQQQRHSKFQEDFATTYQWVDSANPSVLDHLEKKELLQRIQMWIQQEVHDEQERLILYLSYEQNLKPDAIAQHHPEQFTTAQEVRRIKERILKRARRALTL